MLRWLTFIQIIIFLRWGGSRIRACCHIPPGSTPSRGVKGPRQAHFFWCFEMKPIFLSLFIFSIEMFLYNIFNVFWFPSRLTIPRKDHPLSFEDGIQCGLSQYNMCLTPHHKNRKIRHSSVSFYLQIICFFTFLLRIISFFPFSGIFFILPCIEAYQKVDLRTITLDVPPQEVCGKI